MIDNWVFIFVFLDAQINSITRLINPELSNGLYLPGAKTKDDDKPGHKTVMGNLKSGQNPQSK
jgi:hypothetical protein